MENSHFIFLLVATLIVTSRAAQEIFIKNMAGAVIKIEVEPTNLIAELKEKITEKNGVSADRQRLIFKGGILGDERTIADCGIEAGQTVHFAPRIRNSHKRIFIKYWDDRSFPVEVMLEESVASLKQKIRELERIPESHQILVLDSMEVKAESDTLAESGIEDATILNLYVWGSDGSMQACIRYDDERKLLVDVKRNETIGTLKQKINDKIPAHGRRRELFIQNLKLANSSTIEENGIFFYTILTMVTYPPSVPIHVRVGTLDGGIFQVPIDSGDTVSTLKQRISKLRSIPEDHQILKFGREVLEDKKTIADYHIDDLSNISLVVRKGNGSTQVRVWYDERNKVLVDVHPDDTIASLKRRIDTILPAAGARREIFLNNKQLDNNMLATDCGIKPEASLHLVTFLPSVPITVAINTLDGQSFFASVNSGDLIVTLKHKIHETKHIPEHRQRLVYRDMELSESRTFNDYDIQNNVSIRLETRVIH